MIKGSTQNALRWTKQPLISSLTYIICTNCVQIKNAQPEINPVGRFFNIFNFVRN